MSNFTNYYINLNKDIKSYFQIIYPYIPIELQEYIDIIIRLKDIDYFCGMKYASKDMYNFKCNISRLDHSISCALQALRYTDDFEIVLSALYHDCNTPIFSHVVDYLYEDYIKQEKSEENNDSFLLNNAKLLKLLAKDNYNIERIINPRQHSIVDNKRPRLCIDRLDGIFLTSLSWTKTITLEDISRIINNIVIRKNEDTKEELCACDYSIAFQLVSLENTINTYCKSKEDIFMMRLTADLLKYCLNKQYITEDELYTLTEESFITLIKNIMPDDLELSFLYEAFTKTNKVNILDIKNTKTRVLKPLYLSNTNTLKRYD